MVFVSSSFVMVRGEGNPLMHLKSFQKEFVCLCSIPQNRSILPASFSSDAVLRRVRFRLASSVPTSTASNPIAILTAREFD